jgi:transposase
MSFEPAAQFRVLLAQRGLAGGDRVLRLDAGVEQVLEVGVLVVRTCRLTPASAARDTIVSLPSDRSGVPLRSLSMAASISRRSSADKGHAHDSTRAALRRLGVRHAIPGRRDQQARRAAKGSRGGRPPDFGKQEYKQRNVVERCFGRLKQWRDLATRYAKRAAICRSCLVLIAAIIWLGR